MFCRDLNQDNPQLSPQDNMKTKQSRASNRRLCCKERALGSKIRAPMRGECISPGRTPERHAATAHRARPDVMSGAGRSREKSRRLINDKYLRGQGRRYHFQSSPWTRFKTHGEMMGEAIVQFISAQPVLQTAKPSSKFGSRGIRTTSNGGSAVSRPPLQRSLHFRCDKQLPRGS